MADDAQGRIPVSPDRSRATQDESLRRELRAKGYGYKKVASEYRHQTG